MVDFLVKKLENTCLYKAKTEGGDSGNEDGSNLIDDDCRYREKKLFLPLGDTGGEAVEDLLFLERNGDELVDERLCGARFRILATVKGKRELI